MHDSNGVVVTGIEDICESWAFFFTEVFLRPDKSVRKIQTHPLLFGYAVLHLIHFTRRESEKNGTVLIYEKHMSKTSQ